MHPFNAKIHRIARHIYVTGVKIDIERRWDGYDILDRPSGVLIADPPAEIDGTTNEFNDQRK